MKMTAKLRRISFILIFALTITNFAGMGVNSAVTVQAATAQTATVQETTMKAAIAQAAIAQAATVQTATVQATNGIVKGPKEVDAEASYTTTLSSGESVTIKIVNSVLTIKVNATEYTFQIKKIKSTTDAAVVKEEDGLLHILTLGGVYYVFDLYTGVQIVAYRNSSNGKYCSSRNPNAYMVYGKSLINNTYFYELLTSNSGVRELLMTRAEFDVIVNRGDPSVDPTPTQAPTPVPTIVPTQAPTPTPTVVPTQAPTQTPTAVPTQVPTPTPIVVPTQTPDITIQFDFNFWWEKYVSGVITWEQFTQVVYQYQWKVDKTATEKETTYYFYDDKGNLIRTERILISNGTDSGTGNGSATITNKGEANISVTEKGNGGVTGTVTVTTNKATTTAKKTTKKKVKAHARVITSGSRIKLFTAKNKLHGWLLFNRKTGKLNWNGYKMKGVKSAGFIKGSWNVVVLMKNGKVYKLPKKVAKGKTIHKTRIKCKDKGIALNRDTYGFVYKVKTRCGGLKNISGK